jgi:hypothetical protein
MNFLKAEQRISGMIAQTNDKRKVKILYHYLQDTVTSM